MSKGKKHQVKLFEKMWTLRWIIYYSLSYLGPFLRHQIHINIKYLSCNEWLKVRKPLCHGKYCPPSLWYIQECHGMFIVNQNLWYNGRSQPYNYPSHFFDNIRCTTINYNYWLFMIIYYDYDKHYCSFGSAVKLLHYLHLWYLHLQ